MRGRYVGVIAVSVFAVGSMISFQSEMCIIEARVVRDAARPIVVPNWDCFCCRQSIGSALYMLYENDRSKCDGFLGCESPSESRERTERVHFFPF